MYSKTAKICFNRCVGRMWASFAPIGAVNTLLLTMAKRAGRYTNPRELSGKLELLHPVTINPIVPATAIGKPHAAEVAMQLRMATLHQVSIGTVSVPPPMPTRAETLPIMLPMPKVPQLVGNSLCGFGLMFNVI